MGPEAHKLPRKTGYLKVHGIILKEYSLRSHKPEGLKLINVLYSCRETEGLKETTVLEGHSYSINAASALKHEWDGNKTDSRSLLL